MSIVISIALIGLATQVGAWAMVIAGMAVVKLADYITSFFKGKWQ